MREPLLEIQHLKKFFPIQKTLSGKVNGYVQAVNDVSFTVGEQETVGLVGESGCGKSTVGNCILRLLDPDSGKILYHDGQGGTVDLATLSQKALLPYRRKIQMIFQDPYSSLDPRMTTRDIISEPLITFRACPKSEMKNRVAELMQKVGLRPEYMQRYPHAFSGGTATAGSVSPGRLPSIRGSSSATSRCPRWMYRCRRKFSIFSLS